MSSKAQTDEHHNDEEAMTYSLLQKIRRATKQLGEGKITDGEEFFTILLHDENED